MHGEYTPNWAGRARVKFSLKMWICQKQKLFVIVCVELKFVPLSFGIHLIGTTVVQLPSLETRLSRLCCLGVYLIICVDARHLITLITHLYAWDHQIHRWKWCPICLYHAWFVLNFTMCKVQFIIGGEVMEAINDYELFPP